MTSDIDPIAALSFIATLGIGGHFLPIYAMLRERERTNHDAAPAARARTDADRGRTDKADSRPGEGTGDTPETQTTPGACSVPREGTEPVAWGVMRVGSRWVSILDNAVQAETSRQSFDRMENWVHEVVPLYRQPPCQDFPQKNLTLTDAEREVVEACREFWQVEAEAFSEPKDQHYAATLRGLLERTK